MKTFDFRKGVARVVADSASLAWNLYFARRYPVSIIHFVTNRCNARCAFCFIDFDSPDAFKGELTLEEIDRFSRTLGPQLKNVNLTGGEPFARKDILDIARLYYRNTEIESIFITSNGSLPERVSRFSEEIGAEFPDRKLFFSFSIDARAEKHDRIRCIPGLFEKCLQSYRAVRDGPSNAVANVAITVSHSNHDGVLDLYDHLVRDQGVTSITCTAVRDEGVYRIPEAKKKQIHDAYSALSMAIEVDIKSGRLEGYDPSTMQGRMMNRKNGLMNEIIRDIYMDNHFVAQCQAGSLLGIVNANGLVRPCETLDIDFGNLRDNDLDFMRIWSSGEAREMRRWRRETECTCTYECAWSYNILGNAKFAPDMVGAALGLDKSTRRSSRVEP